MKKIVLNMRLLSKTGMAMLIASAMIASSCDFIDDLPEENSIADETPPTAAFTFSNGDDIDDFTEVQFSNQSNNQTGNLWDFGGEILNEDGEVITQGSDEFMMLATSLEPTVIYTGEGSFTATLTVDDALGQTSTVSQVIELVEPEPPSVITPEITGAEFEDFLGVCGDEMSSDSRDCWRISGATIHQTTSNGDRDEDGNRTRAAKYPPGGDLRVSYQAITVSPNTQYALIARYALEADGDMITLSVIDGQLSDFSEFETATILASDVGTINEGNDSYNTIIITFETGANGDISLLFNNGGNLDDTYIDNVQVVPQ